jgi:two-component system response regulator (stage 0 sporulation protein F)
MATVLVVDDEPSIRDLLHLVFRRKGHDVLLADCGSKALELSHREKPHIVILDLLLPGMSGIEVLKHMRTADPELPILIFTGMGNEEAEKQARQLGALAFLEKAFSLHELGQAFNDALERLAATRPVNGQIRNS